MISRLHVKNFKCLLDVDVELGPFTILIGPNDSGKSSLVEAIQLLGRTTKTGWSGAFSGINSLRNLVWRKEAQREISWNVVGKTQAWNFDYTLGLISGREFPSEERLSVDDQQVLSLAPNSNPRTVTKDWPDQKESWQLNPHQTALFTATQKHDPGPFRQIVEALSTSVKYCLETKLLRKENAPIETRAVLSSSGDNLIAVLEQVITGPNPAARSNLENSLHEAVPTIRGIALPTVEGQPLKSLEYTLAGNGQFVTIPAALASDGLLLLTAFLALAYSDTPEIIFIEEPENGLHYSRLQKVIELLRKMSKGEVGFRPHQIIITTHSPLLLNFARPEEVRIFRRTPNGGTEVQSMAKVPDIDKMLKEFGTGELWYSLGEEGLLKGVRP